MQYQLVWVGGTVSVQTAGQKIADAKPTPICQQAVSTNIDDECMLLLDPISRR